MKNFFYKIFKDKKLNVKNLNLTANDILGYISQRWVITKDFYCNDEVFKPLRYPWYSIDTLRKVLPQYQIKELKFAIDALVENHQVDKLNADDWLNIRIASFEAGEKAYEGKFYIKLHEEMKIKNSTNWQKRYWLIIAIFAFVMGSIVSPLSIEWIKHKIWPEPNQSNKTTSINLNPTSVEHLIY